jgi:aromatic-L-amino-acid decarboxylase
MAQEFASWVEADERFELLAPHPLALVTFRLRAGDDATRALMERVNSSGRMYLTHTAVNGQVALRMSIGATLTERKHVEAAWELLSAR